MKILMLGWELPPHNSGGLGVACYGLAKSLASNGLDVDFVLPYRWHHRIKEFKVHAALPYGPDAVFGTAYESFSAPGARLRPNSSDIRAVQAAYGRFVEQYAISNRPDVIHAHDWLTFEAGMRAKAVINKPLIAHVHATEFDRAGNNPGNPLVHEIEYNGLLMADRIIAVSQITKNILVSRYNLPADKIAVVHNAISSDDLQVSADDIQTYAYLKSMKQLGYKIIVSLGRLTMQKGLLFLLSSLEKAVRIESNLLLVVAGSGEQRDELIEKAAELGIGDKVIFTGFVRGRRWRDLYHLGDMFVMSSVSEPFGLTALEAAAAGNAVLLSKQSGVSEILKSAMTFDFWDIDKLANQIILTAQSPALSQELISGGQAVVKSLSWNDVAQRCLEIYTAPRRQPERLPS